MGSEGKLVPANPVIVGCPNWAWSDSSSGAAHDASCEKADHMGFRKTRFGDS